MEEKRVPIGLEAMCWNCGGIWNISLLPADAKNVPCTACGGVVVSETGKAKTRPFYDEFESRAPILEYTSKKILLSDEMTKPPSKIILPD